MREILGISQESFRPLLACQPGSRIGENAEDQGLPVEYVKMRTNFNPLAVAHFIRLYHRYSVDIVHTHSSADSWMASTAAKLSPRHPLVVRTRHLNAPFNNRLIYSFMADRVITVGDSTRRYMIQEKGIPERRVLTIPYGSRFDRVRSGKNPGKFAGRAGNPAGGPGFRYGGGLSPAEGTSNPVGGDAGDYPFCPGAKLLLVGDGPQENNLRNLIQEKGIGQSVLMPGFRNDIARVLNTLDVFVFPSLQEALGTAIVEAMAMKKPVVASRVGGIPEVVVEGRTGYLLDPEDPGAIAERVIRLLKNAELRREMGLESRKFVEAHYDNRLMVQRLEELYRELMGRREN